MLLVFLETIMEIRKEGFFWEIFLVFGEKEARIKSCRSFEVFLFGFLIFFFFDLRRQVLYFWANKQRYIVTKFLR